MVCATELMPSTDPCAEVAAALFHPLGAEGVYARTAPYEDVVARLGALLSTHRDPRAEVLHLPPVMSRRQLERSGYLKSFPNLLGCVCTLHGTESEIRAAADAHELGGDWTGSLAPSDLVLLPAACYPVYPLAASRGRMPPAGLAFDVVAECFRREPSRALSRFQSFRMREFVQIGTPQHVIAFREHWMGKAEQLAAQLSLPCTLEVGNDPFFGRVGQVMAVSQRQQALKFELLVPYFLGAAPTACMSFNYHREHFSTVWDLLDATGEMAHTACVAFGLDRLAVALFCVHGVEVSGWPAAVRQALSF